jgi:hypothetical protein
MTKKFELIEYKASNIKGFNGQKIIIEKSFAPKLDTVNKLAIKHGLIVWVTNSTRIGEVVLKGAIVKPASMSNHKVGHAIDMNLQHIKSGEWFNTAKMRDGVGIDNVFLTEVDLDSQLRWGGRFTTKDEVHIDDGINVVNPSLYMEIYNEIQ